VTSNIAPRLCAEFQNACLKGDFATALKIQDKLAPLHIDLFCEANPGPTKYAGKLLGRFEEELRLPLVPISEKSQQIVRRAMTHAGLIN
jgi:4-hydroxy-tetrahydrodipicolinate synthase